MRKRPGTPTSRNLCATVLLILFSSGCAPSILSLDKAGWQDVLRSPPAVIVLVPEKRVEFAERLWRGLWGETRENYYAFEGIWDPAVVREENCLKTLQMDFGLRTIGIWSNIEAASYREIVMAAEGSFNLARGKGEADAMGSAFWNEWRVKPPEKYLRTIPSEAIRALKDTLGTAYILELSLGGISVLRGGPFVELSVYVYGRLIRLADGGVVWINKGRGTASIERLREFSELERDGLAALKEHYGKAVLALCNSKGVFGFDRYLFTGFTPIE